MSDTERPAALGDGAMGPHRAASISHHGWSANWHAMPRKKFDGAAESLAFDRRHGGPPRRIKANGDNRGLL